MAKKRRQRERISRQSQSATVDNEAGYLDRALRRSRDLLHASVRRTNKWKHTRRTAACPDGATFYAGKAWPRTLPARPSLSFIDPTKSRGTVSPSLSLRDRRVTSSCFIPKTPGWRRLPPSFFLAQNLEIARKKKKKTKQRNVGTLRVRGQRECLQAVPFCFAAAVGCAHGKASSPPCFVCFRFPASRKPSSLRAPCC